jgi:hypothetical protein
MVDCNKQQKEIYKGTQQMRCIHPEADTYKEIVVMAQCEACPLASLVKSKCSEKKQPPIVKKEPQKSQQPIEKPQQTNQLPVLGNPEYPECPFRYDRGKETLRGQPRDL